MNEKNSIVKEWFYEIKKERTSYADMIKFCCDNMVPADYVINELERKGIYFETFCGDTLEYFNADGDTISYDDFDWDSGCTTEYREFFQNYIISSTDAERLKEYTNETVIYNEDLDIYILCVDHWGTPWCSVPANWKETVSE